MAYDFTAASSQYLTIGSSSNFDFANNDPFTVAGWFYFPSLANGTGYQLVNKQQNSGNSTGWAMAYFHQIALADGTNNYVVFQRRNNVSNQAWTSAVFTPTANEWVHIAVTTTNTTNTSGMNNYANGTQLTKSTDQGNSLTSSLSNSVVPQINGRNGANNVTSFRAAEVGIWNVALTADEIASLAKGMTCDKVRPQSLVFYAPLVRNLQDVRGGLTITNNNTATVAVHPRVYT